MSNRGRAALISSVCMAALLLATVWPAPPFVLILEHKVYDILARWAGGGTLSDRVTIVEIDDRSLAQFGRWPWPRDLLGALVRKLLDGGVDTIAFDMMFPEVDAAPPDASRRMIGQAPGPGIKTNDEFFAGSLARGRVVVGFYLGFDAESPGASECLQRSLPLVVVDPPRANESLYFEASRAV